MISIIIPTLNEEHFLPHLLDSLVSQTNKDFEVIVVDGKSKDKTIVVAETYKTKLPSLTIISSKRGLPLQRNVGAKTAHGEWFVFSDADNVFYPYFVERMLVFISSHKPHLFSTWCSPDSDKPNDAMIALFNNLIVEGSLIFKRQFTPGPLTMVDRKSFEIIGGYTNNLTFGEDYDFGRKAMKCGIHFSVLRESLYIWSMRRFRNEGTLKTIQTFSKNIFHILITKRMMTNMPGYVMGGQNYSNKKKKKINKSVLKKLEQTINKFTKELFE